ncbi:elongation of very long chain fatty acids protein 4-like [Leptopilina heterotoma]|uniref:elongation of very long chain fatty acids protein 4-like n=1 Tax=Leptopilina heterotoma TaxID=63436 RepID=UPI001CA939A9|nr:elongation of very long chain fatty acids protein 4-like [Leptopilina heterotoma]
MGLMDTFNYYYHDLADPRMRDRFLLNSIWYPIVILSIYFFIVLKLGPAYMKNRAAYKLNTFIKCFNIFHIFANAYLLINISSCYPFLKVLECRPIIYNTDHCGMLIAKLTYFAIWLKLIDLTETVIYILRKKNNQVSILHLYHHTTTFLIVVVFSKYLTSDVVMLGPILNAFVHVIMYTYYLLSNFEGPIKQKIMPFKRYLTLLQMGQFIIVIAQFSLALTYKHCEVPKWGIIVGLLNYIFNFCLFYSFYRKTYIDTKKKKV